jgi:hypothetical protein
MKPITWLMRLFLIHWQSPFSKYVEGQDRKHRSFNRSFKNNRISGAIMYLKKSWIPILQKKGNLTAVGAKCIITSYRRVQL